MWHMPCAPLHGGGGGGGRCEAAPLPRLQVAPLPMGPSSPETDSAAASAMEVPLQSSSCAGRVWEEVLRAERLETLPGVD